MNKSNKFSISRKMSENTSSTGIRQTIFLFQIIRNKDVSQSVDDHPQDHFNFATLPDKTSFPCYHSEGIYLLSDAQLTEQNKDLDGNGQFSYPIYD